MLLAIRGSLGRETACSRAGASSVPPPPSWRSIRSMACRMFSAVAGTDFGAMETAVSENRIRLNWSESLRLPTRFPMSSFAVSRGYPNMEPDTSSTNMYSRGGISSALTRSGGCTISMKKFSFSPVFSMSPQFISCPVSL